MVSQLQDNRKNRALFTVTAATLAAIALILFLEILEEVVEGSVKPVDDLILALVGSFRNPDITTAATILDRMLLLPYVLLVVAPVYIYLLVTKHYKMAAATGIVMAAASLITAVIKNIILRPRPMMATIHEIGYSFPSGHSSGAVVIYGLIAYVVWRYLVKNIVGRIVVALLAGVMIIATGLSRIYLLVHYPSDVAAGWAVGAVVLFGSIAVLEYVRKH